MDRLGVATNLFGKGLKKKKKKRYVQCKNKQETTVLYLPFRVITDIMQCYSKVDYWRK